MKGRGWRVWLGVCEGGVGGREGCGWRKRGV